MKLKRHGGSIQGGTREDGETDDKTNVTNVSRAAHAKTAFDLRSCQSRASLRPNPQPPKRVGKQNITLQRCGPEPTLRLPHLQLPDQDTVRLCQGRPALGDNQTARSYHDGDVCKYNRHVGTPASSKYQLPGFTRGFRQLGALKAEAWTFEPFSFYSVTDVRESTPERGDRMYSP